MYQYVQLVLKIRATWAHYKSLFYGNNLTLYKSALLLSCWTPAKSWSWPHRKTFLLDQTLTLDLGKSWPLLPGATWKSPALRRSPKYGRWRHFLRKDVVLSVIKSLFEDMKNAKMKS